ncbi:hypothetical protein ACQ4LE_005109 [Meloidogyne hapla]|uniref:C-type lectin domain-containing protein n=1 Tax=Meloidogyne hapla TaxID=6305 RepID=A0A1I8BB94_MELHA
MKLCLSIKFLLTFFISIEIIYVAFVSGDCSDDWQTLADDNGIVSGYQLIKRNYSINYYHARVICNEIGGSVVNIHNEVENGFVAQLSGPESSNWIGTHIIPNNDSSVECLLSDLNQCDYGTYNSTSDLARQEYPWLSLDMNSDSLTDEFGDPIECVKMLDTSFDGFDSSNVQWLEVPCYDRLDGVICKKSCDN